MSLLDKLEKKFQRFGIPNLTLHIIIGQSLVYILAKTGRVDIIRLIQLIPAQVLEGEVWRLLTFLFVPKSWHPLFLFFALYLFYLMGSSLENFGERFAITFFF